jgi:hypothetical protein
MRRPRRARRVSVPFSCSGRLLVTAAAVLMQVGCSGGDKATLATFAVRYYGHDRGLAITRDGRAQESVNSGCCYRVIDLRFQLSQPRGTPRNLGYGDCDLGALREEEHVAERNPSPARR